MSRGCLRFAGAVVVLSGLVACSGDGSPETTGTTTTTIPAEDLARSGGDGTLFDAGRDAFSQSMPTLNRDERRAFNVGNNFFNDNWVTAPASTEGRDGLGPLFNAQSCSSCHEFDGRGAPPVDDDDPQRGLLLRLSVMGPDGQPIPDEVYGGQLQDRAINGVPPEGRIVIERTETEGSFDDGTPYSLEAPTYTIDDLGYGPIADDVMISPRIAPAIFGVGLLEAVPQDALLATADADDLDGDGISGRPNMVEDEAGHLVIGRFGWKANVATVNQQNAGAFHGDIGITTSLHPDQDCTSTQTACLDAPTGGEPEVDDAKLQRVTFYTRTLAVPARRDVDDPEARSGEALFASAGCSSCHLPQLTTGASDIPVLADQTIRPYTDLLLHDMGEGLADDRPDGLATGSEWRTAPLWGIGLVDDVNEHTRFLHDGRARSIEEAILWHGGEAAAAQRAYRAMPADDRRQLLMFLESL